MTLALSEFGVYVERHAYHILGFEDRNSLSPIAARILYSKVMDCECKNAGMYSNSAAFLTRNQPPCHVRRSLINGNSPVIVGPQL